MICRKYTPDKVESNEIDKREKKTIIPVLEILIFVKEGYIYIIFDREKFLPRNF